MIFETIAAIKIANEAVAAIKQFAGHVSSVGELGTHLTKLADAKEVIEAKSKNGDMECFFELEKINQREAEIKQLFIYQGRPGLWEDYCKFINNRKQIKENARKRNQAQKARRARVLKEWCIGIAVALATLSAIGICGYFLYWILGTKR